MANFKVRLYTFGLGPCAKRGKVQKDWVDDGMCSSRKLTCEQISGFLSAFFLTDKDLKFETGRMNVVHPRSRWQTKVGSGPYERYISILYVELINPIVTIKASMYVW